jgi:hypothetical protein
MPPNKETPASQRRQAVGRTGATNHPASVPAWARKRAGEALLRFRGQYTDAEAIHATAALEAVAAREGRAVAIGHGDAFGMPAAPDQQGAGGSPSLETPAPYANRFSWGSSIELVDGSTGELLPCRSLETTASRGTPGALTGPHKKVASALSWNVAHLCQKYGVERVGFLTLTFADHVTDVREASRRFHSLASNVLKQRYGHYIRVLERQKSGRIHYHLLVVLPDDIRTGADFDAFARRDYKSANNHLRREWAYWRKTACFYGFGRTELMPVRSDAAALGQYVGKYIGKHIGQREERDKGARLVSYSGDARMATSKHSALTTHPDQWRAKVLTFSRLVAGAYPHARIRDMDDLAFHMGKRWAYTHRDFILSLPPADLTVPF